MTHLRHTSPPTSLTLRRMFGLVALAVMLGSAIWAARVTQAEFEVPLVDTTDFVPTEFRSIWSYKRSLRWTDGDLYENYEGFAVGKPLNSVNGTTSLYRFDGTTWEKILPQGTATIGANYQLNAVGGQFDDGAGYALGYMFGYKGGANRQAYGVFDPNFPESYGRYNRNAVNFGQTLAAAHANAASPYVIDMVNSGDTLLNPTPNYSELYAVDVYPQFLGEIISGGMNGWLAVRRQKLGGNCYKTIVPDANTTPPTDCAAAAESAGKEKWRLFQLTPSTMPPNTPVISPPLVADNITGIKFVSVNTAYVTTSTFKLGLADGQPKAPYLRDCANDGTSISKLFRIDNSVTSSTNWKLLKTVTGECFYGLTATPIDTPTTNNGPLQTDTWIASSKGIRRITDDNNTTPTTLVKDTTTDPNTNIRNKAIYGVTSAYERSGQGQQLLLNGDFQSWVLPLTSTPSPGTINSPTVDPSAWRTLYEATYTRSVDGTCGLGNRDLRMLDRGGSPKNWGLVIEPGLEYTGSGCATPSTAARDRHVMAYQRVYLTDTEGTRYRVSGSYKVTYVDHTSWPATSKPTRRQGGIVTACTGGYPPASVDCPFSNMKELKTLSSSADSMTSYRNFSFEFTRANKQYQGAIQGGGGVPWVANEGQVLEIRCQATYGVRVECDDIKVEVVDDPPLPARSVVSVLGVGQAGLTLLNPDAVGAPTTWNIDDASLLSLSGTNQITLNSVVNAGGANIFAAGSGTALFRRSPGNINGFAWLGAVQTGTTGNAGLGWIATNCANLRDGSAPPRSLCQRQSQSFGLSLEKNSAGVPTLSGRAWFGKQLTTNGTNDDTEARDLGTCLQPARRQNGLAGGDLPASQPYNMGSSPSCIDIDSSSAVTLRCSTNTSRSCTTATVSFDCGPQSCNQATKTCFRDSTKACLRDYDCYGRCSGDEGFICLSDSDCSGTKPSLVPSIASSQLRAAPTLNLLCGSAGSSPSACTAAGWLTFNVNDLPTAQQTPPVEPGAPVTFGVTYDETTGKLNGWGRFMTLANTSDPNYQANQGWLKLRGPATAPTPTGSRIYGAQSCSSGASSTRCTRDLANTCSSIPLIQTCLGLGGTCTTLSASTCLYGYDRSLQSCTPAADSCTNYCGNNTNQPCSTDTECADFHGNTTDSCEPIGYCSNLLGTVDETTETCTSDGGCDTAGSFCVRGAVCNSTSGNTCNQYGVDHDQQTGKFQGFAWSAEYGWVDFRSIQKGTTRFLQTRLGDIYAGGDISATINNCSTSRNATYLVSSSGTITNFCSDLGSTGIDGVDVIQENQLIIPITSSKNDYSTALGRFDLTGLETATTIVPPHFNKYGLPITEITPSTDPATYGSITTTTTSSPLNDFGSIILGQRVLIANCPDDPAVAGTRNECTLNQALKFANAPAGSSGAGILVVNGHLTIKNNMQYISSRVDDLRQLASLVVVVRGDLNIENSVTNVVGAYYVDGTIFTTPTASATSSGNRYPLTVRGLMIAKNFEFNRRFAGTVESPLPSELFIFDGRLQSNPLPGMSDFASALPNTQNSSP